MAIEIADVGRDLRRGLEVVNASAPRAASEVWSAFLEHASKPVRFDAPPHPDNDVLAFEVERSRDAPGRMLVRLERRVGVETRELEYLGTIVAACYLEVLANDAASALPDTVSITGHGASAGLAQVQQFRCHVEDSSAFLALMGDGVARLVVSVSDL
jgi:hypothetical protein